MRHMKTTLEELNIGYRMPLQPVSFHPASAPINSAFGIDSLRTPGVGRAASLARAPPPVTARIGRY